MVNLKVYVWLINAGTNIDLYLKINLILTQQRSNMIKRTKLLIFILLHIQQNLHTCIHYTTNNIKKKLNIIVFSNICDSSLLTNTHLKQFQ